MAKDESYRVVTPVTTKADEDLAAQLLRVQLEKEQLELAEARRRVQAFETEKDAIDRHRASKKARVEQERQARNAKQQYCRHMLNESARIANVGGQRNHKGQVILVCQDCNKVMIGADQIPPHIQALLPSLHIGGPEITGYV